MNSCTAPQVEDRQPAIGYPKFRYTGNDDIRVLYRMDMFDDSFVEVVGAPDWGSYEWVIWEKGKITRHSDSGYGWTAVAFRDGLNEYLGDK
jgi:hypothetical protein